MFPRMWSQPACRNVAVSQVMPTAVWVSRVEAVDRTK